MKVVDRVRSSACSRLSFSCLRLQPASISIPVSAALLSASADFFLTRTFPVIVSDASYSLENCGRPSRGMRSTCYMSTPRCAPSAEGTLFLEELLSHSQLLCNLSLFKMVLKCDFPATPSTKATEVNRPGPMMLSIQFAGAATRSDFMLDYSCCSASPPFCFLLIAFFHLLPSFFCPKVKIFIIWGAILVHRFVGKGKSCLNASASEPG